MNVTVVAERFARELESAITEVTGSDDDSDLSPGEVARRALKTALRRIGQTEIVDHSDASDQLDDAADYWNSGSVPPANKMYSGVNGFE